MSGGAARRILGVDPGSRVTGYGLIDSDGRHSVHIDSGCIRAASAAWPERLGVIFRELSAVVDRYRPRELAVEQVFFARNAASALKLGQARGAAICAALSEGIRVSEYSPRAVKLAVVGTGGADKAQVQHMVKAILGLSGDLLEDQADALAVAICHAHSERLAAGQGRASSWRAFTP